MIERDFIAQKTKEYYIKNYIESRLRGAEISQIKLKKIPLGEKIIIKTSRPSLIVGSKGANIRKLTGYLKSHFKLENPQIEIKEVKNIFLDANVMANRIVSSLERFGSARFKGIGHKTMENVLKAGALGVEIKISGKIPGARAKNWRFYQGYLKKCGDVSVSGVKTAYASALLKTGIIGVQVRIMPPDLVLPDSVEILDEPIQIVESTDLEKKEEGKKGKKKKAPKKKATKKKTPAKKKTTKKKVTKKEEAVKEKKEEPNETSVSEPSGEGKEEVAEVKEPKEETQDQEESEVQETQSVSEHKQTKFVVQEQSSLHKNSKTVLSEKEPVEDNGTSVQETEVSGHRNEVPSVPEPSDEGKTE